MESIVNNTINGTYWMKANTTNMAISECAIEIQPISWESYSYTPAAKVSTILVIFANLLTMPLTIFFNALVVVAVWKNASLQVERVIVLAYLALTDFLVGLICQPLFIAREVFHLKNESSNCALDTVLYFSMFLLVGTSFYQLVTVTYDKYVAIIHPYEYPTRITVKRLTYGTIGLWVVNIILILFSSLSLLLAPHLHPSIRLFDVLLRTAMISCTLYWYVLIFAAVKKQIRQIEQQQQNVSTTNPRSRQNYKGAITAALLFGVFILSFTPLLISILLRLIHGSNLRGSALLSIQQWIFSCVFFGSLVNPIVYAFRVNELRKKCLNVIGCKPVAIDTLATQNAFVLQPRPTVQRP